MARGLTHGDWGPGFDYWHRMKFLLLSSHQFSATVSMTLTLDIGLLSLSNFSVRLVLSTQFLLFLSSSSLCASGSKPTNALSLPQFFLFHYLPEAVGTKHLIIKNCCSVEKKKKSNHKQTLTTNFLAQILTSR